MLLHKIQHNGSIINLLSLVSWLLHWPTMAASSKQKSPWLAGMVCAGKGKVFPDWSHENRFSARAGGTVATVERQCKVHYPQEHRHGHDMYTSSAQWRSPHLMSKAMQSL